MALEPGWCVILGASSGFGAAAARAFAAAGLDVAGVHLDRRATLPLAEAVAKDVEAAGRRARFWNANAADAEQRDAIVAELATLVAGGPRVRVLLHSLAFGTLKPLVAASAKDAVSPRADRDDARRDGDVAGRLDAGALRPPVSSSATRASSR